MDEMRRKGTGTWDRTQERWKLKKHKIYMKPKALAEVLREGDRAEQADPEVETDDTVEASQSALLSVNSLSSAESKA